MNEVILQPLAEKTAHIIKQEAHLNKSLYVSIQHRLVSTSYNCSLVASSCRRDDSLNIV